MKKVRIFSLTLLTTSIIAFQSCKNSEYSEIPIIKKDNKKDIIVGGSIGFKIARPSRNCMGGFGFCDVTGKIDVKQSFITNPNPPVSGDRSAAGITTKIDENNFKISFTTVLPEDVDDKLIVYPGEEAPIPTVLKSFLGLVGDKINSGEYPINVDEEGVRFVIVQVI